MIGPSCKVDLGQLVDGAIGSLSLHLSTLEVLGFLDVVKELDLDLLSVFIQLRNAIFWLLLLGRRPKLVAFWASILGNLASADYHGHVLLDDHLPEVVRCLWQRSLTRDDFFITKTIWAFKW